jgi:hypothetical protein
MDVKSDFSFTWDDAFLYELEGELEQGIIQGLEDLKAESIVQAPIDSSNLRANCSVIYEGKVISAASAGKNLTPTGKRFSGQVGYTLPYALKQHEQLDYQHSAGGKAKYLQDPFNMKIGTILRDIASRIKRVF